MKLMIVGLVIVAVAACVIGVVTCGALRWRRKNDEFRAKLLARCTSMASTTYDRKELDGLPLPVQRYFRAVLQHKQPIIAAVHISQQGEFRLGEAEDSWRPFEATQLVTTCPPGFDWDARVNMFPGVKVFVQDAYSEGVGILHAAVLGFISVADLRGTPEMAQGELMRYLAEAPWYPTALLPSQGVCWGAIDDSRACAILADRDVRVSVEFHFNAEGLITTALSRTRYRAVGDVLQPTPWEGRFGDYAERGGMRVPLKGEVEWQLPDGPFPYWRGQIEAIRYEIAK